MKKSSPPASGDTSSPTSSNNLLTLRVAIVGCGQIVTHHVNAFAQIQQENAATTKNLKSNLLTLEVVALCDPNMKRREVIKQQLLQSTNNDKTPNSYQEFDSLTQLLENENEKSDDSKPNVDVVFISVPHDLHETIAMEALQAGKHVVMEKPLAPTREACERLTQQARLADKLFIISEQSPYWEEVALAKKLVLQENAIGTVISAASYFYESMRDNVTSGIDEEGTLGWRCSLKRCGGGIVIDGGLHWIRPLREVCGDVKRVMAVTRKNVQPELRLEGESLAHAILEFNSKQKQPNESGPLYATFSANNMHTAPMAHDMCPFFRWTGTLGELVIPGNGLFPNGGGGLVIYDDHHPEGLTLIDGKKRQGGFFLGFKGVWEHIIGILQRNDREAAVTTVVEAAKDVATALAMYESSNCRQWAEVK